MLRIDLELTDEQVESVTEYLKTQFTMETHPVTKLPVRVDKFTGVEDFVEQNFASLLDSVMKQYPPASMHEKLAQIAQLQSEVQADAKPRVRQSEQRQLLS